MPAPEITSLPPAPSRSDAPTVFVEKADAFVAALAQFGVDISGLGSYLDTLAASIDDDQAALEAQMAAFLAAMNALLATAGFSGSSTTSNSIGLGAKTFTTQANRSFVPGANVQVSVTASPAVNFMTGIVTAYNSATGVITIDVKSLEGSGTFSAWTISLSGQRGATGEPGESANVTSEIVNVASVNSAALSAALWGVQSNQADANVLFIGDSNTFGAYSGSDVAPTPNAHASAFAAQLSAYSNDFVPTSIHNRAGDGDAGVALINASDPNINIGTWDVGPGATMGGKFFTATVNGAAMTISCPDDWDSFELFYVRAASDTALSVGTLNLSGPTGEAASVDAKTAPGTGQSAAKLILSRATPASGTVTMTASLDAGEVFYVVGWIFKNSRRHALHFVNAGIRGADTGTSNFTPIGLSRDNGFDYVMLGAIQGVWKPVLTFIMVGTNDARLGGLNPGIATFKANVRLIIKEALKSGSVVMMVPPDIAPAVEGPVPFSDYRKAIYDLAKENGLALVDFQKVLGTHAESVANGTQKDDLHPNAAGHALLARSLRRVVDRALSGSSYSTVPELRALNANQGCPSPAVIAGAADYVPLTDAATVALDLSTGSNFSLLTTAGVGATRALGAPTNGKPGMTYSVEVTTDATGRALTYNAAFKWPRGTKPTLPTTAGARSRIQFQMNSVGTFDAVGLEDMK